MSGILCIVMDKGLPAKSGWTCHLHAHKYLKVEAKPGTGERQIQERVVQVWGALQHCDTGRSHPGCKSSEFQSPSKIRTQWKMANVNNSHDDWCQWLRQTPSENNWPRSIGSVLVLKYTVNFTNICLYCRFHRLCFDGKKLPIIRSCFRKWTHEISSWGISRMYEGRTESHVQLFFCMQTGNSRRRRVRW